MDEELDVAGGLSLKPSSERAAVRHCRGGRVLIVDDSYGHRLSLAVALRDEGYDVAEACDGAAAIEYLLGSPTPCAILLDLMMPIRSGWDVLSLLRGHVHLSKVPVIIVTGQSAGIQVSGASVIARFQKPIRLEEILRILQDLSSADPRR